jgi:hypothetical protein
VTLLDAVLPLILIVWLSRGKVLVVPLSTVDPSKGAIALLVTTNPAGMSTVFWESVANKFVLNISVDGDEVSIGIFTASSLSVEPDDTWLSELLVVAHFGTLWSKWKPVLLCDVTRDLHKASSCGCSSGGGSTLS